MKKIIISSIFAVTACLSMVGQANAAPHFIPHQASQVQHQKHGNKDNHKHKQMNNKKNSVYYHSKAAPAKYKVKGKYQGKHIEGHRG